MGTVLAYVAAMGASVLVLALAGVARTRPIDEATTVTVLAGCVLVLGWALIPLLTFGIDETLDPARFAVLPLRSRQLVPGLTVTALIGAPGLATVAAGLGAVLAWTRDPLSVLVALPAAVLAVLTCVVASRVVTTAAAGVLSGRRARDLAGLVSILLVTSVGLLPRAVEAGAARVQDLDTLVAVLGWTPLGAAWAAPAAVAVGDVALGLAHLAVAAAFVAAGLVAWTHLLARQLERPAGGSGGGGARATGGTPLFDRLPATPTWAVTVRCLRYWRRDPRYLTVVSSSLIIMVVFGVMLQVGGDGDSQMLVALGPFLGLLVSLSAANDIGSDGSAFAAHLATGVSGRADRLGRAAALLVWTIPLVTLACVGGALLAGRPELAPAGLGMGLATLLGGIGAGSVAAVLAPYPMPEAGANPFRANSGAGARAVLAQAVVGAASLATAAPAVVATVLALLVSGWFVWLALVLGTLAGAAALAAGVVLGGRVLDQRGPEVLAAVRRSG